MKLRDLLARLLPGTWGFEMQEQMSGTHVFEPPFGDPDERGPFCFTITWGPRDLWQWLNPRDEEFLCQELRGTVTVAGLCEQAPCAGVLELRYFGEHVLRYTFEFQANGLSYRYVGEKVNIRPWNLPVSHTTCFGVLTEARSGRLVSRSVTHFRMSTAIAFLRSLRLLHGAPPRPASAVPAGA
jgi:hypothetical protein